MVDQCQDFFNFSGNKIPESILGFNVLIDNTLPPNVIEIRNDEGMVLMHMECWIGLKDKRDREAS